MFLSEAKSFSEGFDVPKKNRTKKLDSMLVCKTQKTDRR